MKHQHHRKHELPFSWPETPFEIGLISPEIPPNTGNIARLCAATGSKLHLVDPLGFNLSDKALKRAGLDYWDAVNQQRHNSLTAFREHIAGQRFFLFSTSGHQSFYELEYEPGDVLMFGSETKGLPQDLLDEFPEKVAGIPMQVEHVRSLNLANSVSIVLYEALRQIQAR